MSKLTDTLDWIIEFVEGDRNNAGSKLNDVLKKTRLALQDINRAKEALDTKSATLSKFDIYLQSLSTEDFSEFVKEMLPVFQSFADYLRQPKVPELRKMAD